MVDVAANRFICVDGCHPGAWEDRGRAVHLHSILMPVEQESVVLGQRKNWPSAVITTFRFELREGVDVETPFVCLCFA